jgi:hypothetical protein
MLRSPQGVGLGHTPLQHHHQIAASSLVNFHRLSIATVRDYLKKYGVPFTGAMEDEELREAADRHFAQTPADDFSAIEPAQHAIARFHACLVERHKRQGTSRKRERAAITVKPRSAYASTQAYNAALAATATLPTAKHNRDGSCIVGCKYKGSIKSGGTMIACDGESHGEKWFHLSCVGLTETPKGEWFCFVCDAERSLLAKRARMAAAHAASGLGGGGGGGGGSARPNAPLSDNSSASLSSSSMLPSSFSGGKPSMAAAAAAAGKPRVASTKSAYVAFIQAALKAIAVKKKRAAPEGTLKEITAMVQAKFGSRLDARLENDARHTPVWKAQIHKIMRSSKTGFAKVKRNGQLYYTVEPSKGGGGGGGGGGAAAK